MRYDYGVLRRDRKAFSNKQYGARFFSDEKPRGLPKRIACIGERLNVNSQLGRYLKHAKPPDNRVAEEMLMLFYRRRTHQAPTDCLSARLSPDDSLSRSVTLDGRETKVKRLLPGFGRVLCRPPAKQGTWQFRLGLAMDGKSLQVATPFSD